VGVVKHCSLDVRGAAELVEVNKKSNNYRLGIIKVHSKH
jgi:hypothetical protein